MPKVSKRRKKSKTSTRRKTTKKSTRKSPKKRTTKTTVAVNPTIEERQLAVYHNPFSRATKQPKIPDGKITESLGFQTQAVGEFVCRNGSTAPVTGNGQLHILLYCGQNCGMSVINEFNGAYSLLDPTATLITTVANRVRNVRFNGSNAIDATGMTGIGGDIAFADDYGLWRCVSQGLRLSLLNPAETDDGWWEASRITEPQNLRDWAIMSTDNEPSFSNCCIAPRDLLAQLINKDISNQNSYSTGLLRDLRNHVFTNHALKDFHDLKEQKNGFTINSGEVAAFDNSAAAGYAIDLNRSTDGAQALYDQWIDDSFDMIYIRVHGRSQLDPTRLHYNIVSNQEIVYGLDSRDSRHQTVCGRVGNMDEHISARKGNNSASHLIPP